MFSFAFLVFMCFYINFHVIAPECLRLTPVFRGGGLLWGVCEVGQFLPHDGREKDVAEWKQVHLKCSGPLPAKGVLHTGAQLTNGVKFNEGNWLSYESH